MAGTAGARPPQTGIRVAALGLVGVVAAVVWFTIPAASRTALGPATSTERPTTSTTVDPNVSVYGCPIRREPDAGASDGPVADPDCTDASVVAEYCTIPRESIATPGTVQESPTELTRTYQTTAGLPAGSVTHFADGAGLPVYPMTLLCATKRTFGFTAADVDAFTRPA